MKCDIFNVVLEIFQAYKGRKENEMKIQDCPQLWENPFPFLPFFSPPA